LGIGLEPIIVSINGGNTHVPILDPEMFPYPDWMILSAYYTRVGPANLIIDYGLGALSGTQYLGVNLAEIARLVVKLWQ
jgi:hypothetical protein